jgi:hypothetical protein
MQIDDLQWANLRNGYGTPYDPRPALRKIESNTNAPEAWAELWNELHHQGDVGEASYIAIPELVRICRARQQLDWNTFALVATIELARDGHHNPPIPSWLETNYFAALRELAHFGAAEMDSASDAESIRSVLSVIAISKGLRALGRMLLIYSDDEWLEMEKRLMG